MVLSFCIGPPYGRANTANLEPNTPCTALPLVQKYIRTLSVIFCGLRLCYAQSHNDNGHMHATAQSMFCTCTCSGLAHNIMHSFIIYIYIYILGIRLRIFASRQCAQTMHARHMRVPDTGEARVARVTAVGEASSLVFVVSKPRWPRCVPDLHLHHPRSI